VPDDQQAAALSLKMLSKEPAVKTNVQKLSPAIFVLALICFFLPFVTFSCQGQKVLSLSGIQLVTGTSVPQPQMIGPPTSQKINAEPLAVLAFLCGILGLGLSFLKGRTGAIVPAGTGGLAAVLLLVLKSKIEGDALSKGSGVIQVSYDAGFYVVLALFLAALALNIFVLLQGKSLALASLGAGGESRFCTQCGSRNLGKDEFCKECGAKLA
jgi:hypothetical protein